MNHLPESSQRRFEDIATNPLAERSLISHMIQRPRDIDLITSYVTPGDFADDSLRRLFILICDLFDSGQLSGNRADSVLLTTLHGSQLLKELGGPRFVAELFDIPPTAPKVHAAEVQRRACLRQLLLSAGELQESILSGVSYTQALEDHQATIESVLNRQADETKSVGQLMREFEASLDDWKPPEIMTGLESFDTKVGGFARGRLITICAGTGGGKSALGLQIANHNGMKGRPCLYLTMEMLDVEKVKRLLNNSKDLSGVNFEADQLTQEQRHAVRAEVERHQDSRLYIRHMATPKWRDVERRIREFRARHGLSLVVVDYVGLVQKADPRQTTQERTAEVTAGLKRLAMQLKCVVIGLVQFNREAAKTKKGDLHNLADSASVERDSDLVLAVHQPHPESTCREERNQRELHILKNRTGLCGILTGYEFVGERMLFREKRFYEFG